MRVAGRCGKLAQRFSTGSAQIGGNAFGVCHPAPAGSGLRQGWQQVLFPQRFALRGAEKAEMADA